MRSALGRVRGLGSAKEGVGHWWAQRMTALALVPLAVWFVAAVIAITGADHASARDWLSSPLVAGPMLLVIVATFYHGALGLQVVIEDYVQHEAAKLAALIAVNALSLALALACTLAVLKILLGA